MTHYSFLLRLHELCSLPETLCSILYWVFCIMKLRNNIDQNYYTKTSLNTDAFKCIETLQMLSEIIDMTRNKLNY